MEKVVCYCRVSTEEEKQLNALEHQVEELEAFVEAREDWELVGTYVDEGKTGTTTKSRKSYQQLFNDLLTDKFSIVVIKDQSRLMRNVLDWYMFIDRINKNKKKLFMYLDNQYYTPENAFITGIKAMMAEEYSRDLSRKLVSAARRSQKNGVILGNGSIYGYNMVDGKYVIDDAQACVVREIYNLYAQGYGTRKILIMLTDRGIKSTIGTNFSLSTLKRILKNEKYKGVLVGHKFENDFENKTVHPVDPSEYIKIPNAVPAIVSEELWDKCAAIREKRLQVFLKSYEGRDLKDVFKGQSGKNSGKYNLSSKVYCGKCHRTMWHDPSTSQSKIPYNAGRDVSKWTCRTYRTYGKNHKEGCVSTRTYHAELMSCIRFVIKNLANEDTMNSINNVLNVLATTLSEKNSNGDISKYNQELQQIMKKQSKLLDMFLDETIGKVEYNEKKEELAAKQASIEKIIADYNKVDKTVKDKTTRLKEIETKIKEIQDNPDCISQELIDLIVRFVIINDKNEAGRYSIEIIFDFNDNQDATIDTERITLFNTTYPFIKQCCVDKTEDWDIIVSLI